MRIHPLLVGLLAASLALTAAPFSRAQDDEPTPLQEAMGKMQGSQRAMRRMVGDPTANKDALLRAVATIEEGALEAFVLAPPAPDGADAVAWRIGYKRQILKTLDAALACEQATHEGNADALAAAYQALNATKKAGHDQYQR